MTRIIEQSKNPSMTSPLYRMGYVTFSIEDCDEEMQNQFLQILPSCHESEFSDQDVLSISMLEARDILGVLNRVFKAHKNCLWIDAACLVSPQQKVVLLAGRTHAGKSTTAMALTAKLHWKVVSEDLTLFDLAKDRILSFNSPFSVRPDTRELLAEAIGHEWTHSIQQDYSAVGPFAESSHISAKIDVAIFLSRIPSANFVVDAMSGHEFVRSIVRCSNILDISESAEKLTNYLSSAKCFGVTDGTLTERLTLLDDLCQREPTK